MCRTGFEVTHVPVQASIFLHNIQGSLWAISSSCEKGDEIAPFCRSSCMLLWNEEHGSCLHFIFNNEFKHSLRTKIPVSLNVHWQISVQAQSSASTQMFYRNLMSLMFGPRIARNCLHATFLKGFMNCMLLNKFLSSVFSGLQKVIGRDKQWRENDGRCVLGFR